MTGRPAPAWRLRHSSPPLQGLFDRADIAAAHVKRGGFFDSLAEQQKIDIHIPILAEDLLQQRDLGANIRMVALQAGPSQAMPI